jgi:hypothetical protein
MRALRWLVNSFGDSARPLRTQPILETCYPARPVGIGYEDPKIGLVAICRQFNFRKRQTATQYLPWQFGSDRYREEPKMQRLREKVQKLPGAYRVRREASEYLQSRGFPVSFSTLNKLCALGEGPEPAVWWGSRPLYTDPTLDAWAEARSRTHAKTTKQLTENGPSRRADHP